MDSESKLRVVVVEDEPELRDNLMICLELSGFEVYGVGNGKELDELLTRKAVDILLLDLGLPDEDGLEIAARLGNNPARGIIMLTARSMTEDRIMGLECGADNYFVKPVEVAELAAAIKNLGRRLAKPITSWRLNAEASSLLTPNEVAVPLTAQECLLLKLLFANLGSNVARSQIFTELGQPDDLCSHPRLEVMISRLRSKVLKLDPASQLPLRARHNMGYSFLSGDGQ